VTRGRAGPTFDSDALVLRRVEYGEADLILTLFTRDHGRVSALARGARKSQRRFAGAFEPFFTIRVRWHERPGTELLTLVHAELARTRIALLSDLNRMDLAGRALAWIRAAAPARSAEPEVFDRMERLLDTLSDPNRGPPELELAQTGIWLLGALGWGLDFERCVRCGTPCPAARSASLDVEAGGLICSACGGARLRLNAEQRRRFARAASGDADSLTREDTTTALALIERVLTAHAGIDGSG